jgi:hypothetical protein
MAIQIRVSHFCKCQNVCLKTVFAKVYRRSPFTTRFSDSSSVAARYPPGTLYDRLRGSSFLVKNYIVHGSTLE